MSSTALESEAVGMVLITRAPAAQREGTLSLYWTREGWPPQGDLSPAPKQTPAEAGQARGGVSWQDNSKGEAKVSGQGCL